MATAGVALDEARALLNDVSTQYFSNTVLIPYLQKAHRELQVLLWENGIDVIKELTAVIDIPANQPNLGVSAPANILTPIRLQERKDGSTSENDWTDVTESDPLPSMEPTSSIMYWTWREEVVQFIASTEAREVKLSYTKGLTLPAAATDSIGFILGELYLGPRTAALAVYAVGNITRASELGVDANIWIPKIIAANVKRGQATPARKIPYRRGLRRFIVGGF